MGGILPARAGVILTLRLKDVQIENFTRTSGGDPDVVKDVTPEEPFYPHERG